MMLILRIAFWIAVVAILLPTAPSIPSSEGAAQAAASPAEEQFDASAAVDMAMSTGSDVLSFCERNQTVCDAVADGGSHVFNQLIYYTGEAMSWATQALIEARQAEGAPTAPPAAQGV